jgi:hypothetical protein
MWLWYWKCWIYPLLNDNLSNDSLENDIDDIISELSHETVNAILSTDIREKGLRMAKVYFYPYCIENSLRLFIDIISKEELYGLKYNNDMIKKI